MYVIQASCLLNADFASAVDAPSCRMDRNAQAVSMHASFTRFFPVNHQIQRCTQMNSKGLLPLLEAAADFGRHRIHLCRMHPS